MKHRIICILGTLLCCLSVIAQTAGDNIYVYRNDGKFNAFLSNEVDSLVYSSRDLNGVDHYEAVVQEIWTPDSVYRIPLSVIDSISVSTPETRYAPKVKKLSSTEYLPYIVGAEDMTVYFSADLPHSLRINKGDILVYEGSDSLFPSGFAGKVETISIQEDRLMITCGSVELGEIYDQYVAVGEYIVKEDPENSSRLLAVPVSRATDTAKFTIPLSLSLDLNKVISINGSAELSLTLKAIVNINRENTYIELISKYNVEAGLGVQAGGQIRKTRFAPFSLKYPVVIPNIPLLMGEIEVGTFIEGSISGSAEVDASISFGGGMKLVYENGKLSSSRLPVSFDRNVEGKIGVEGYVWTGVLVAPSIYVTGHLVDFSWINGVGPYFDFDVALRLNEDNTNAYDRLKDSNYSLSVKLGSDLQTSNIFRGHEAEKITGSEVEFMKSTFHLLPEFSKPDVKTDSKSITVETTATRDLLIPCQVGFRILDENEDVVDTWYSSESKNLSNPALKIGHKFEQGLKQGAKYTVLPIVKLWGIEFQASPREECYLDCNVTTGKSYSALTSFETSGSVKSELPANVEVGFFYTSEKIDPRKEIAKSFKGTFTETDAFKGSVSGLKEGTTYYYCAYVFYNDHYYYGDTQCITTKRNIDKSYDDNFGGGYTSESKPYAETGKSSDIEMKTATIELTFNNVSPTTECGYYLQVDSKKGGVLSSKYYPLGTVTGQQTVQLSDLIPGTDYRYWAVEKNSNGKSVATERTFKTEPSPDPIAKILDIKDIEMQSATLSCYFENIDDVKEFGVEYVDGEFTYRVKATPDDEGKADVKLDKLTAETSYSVKPYVKLDDEKSPSFDEELREFTTDGPEITGWWKFHDGNGRVFDLELRENGRSNNFFGINSLTWSREGRKVKLLWAPQQGTTCQEYLGEFNEGFTRATGEVYYVIISESLNMHEVILKLDSPFYIIRNRSKDSDSTTD